MSFPRLIMTDVRLSHLQRLLNINASEARTLGTLALTGPMSFIELRSHLNMDKKRLLLQLRSLRRSTLLIKETIDSYSSRSECGAKAMYGLTNRARAACLEAGLVP